MFFTESGQINVMTKSLDALWLKQRVISDNIANRDTPGYKAKYVKFSDVLAEEERCKSPLHHYPDQKEDGGVKTLATLGVSEETSLRADGNNVNTDKEMLEIDRTALQYEYLSRKLTGNFTRLRSVIKGGR